MRVIILNWVKIQGRPGVKSPHWFKFKNKFFYDSDFFIFTAQEKLVWLYILCEASLQNKDGEVTVNNEHAVHWLAVGQNVVESCLKKLKQLRIVELKTSRGRYISARNLRTRRDEMREEEKREEEKTHTHDDNVVRVACFDFEKIYQKYPRKEGKQKGIKTCQGQINTEETYQELIKAVDNYCAYCQKNAIERRYTKQFSTFMSSWRDWLEVIPQEPESTNKYHPNSFMAKLSREEQIEMEKEVEVIRKRAHGIPVY